MKQFNKVTIIGVGLIGGSIGLGIKQKRLADKVIGVFRHKSTLNKALKRKAVDAGAMTVADGVRDADLIILATPVHLIPKMAEEAIKNAKKGAIITDVGSTKKWIVDRIEKLPCRAQFFVGSHPMAGSEHTGVEFAVEDLLEGSPCIVTKTGKTNKAAMTKLIRFWKALGAKVKVTSPEEHDRSVALVSHLPHLVAFSLAGAVPIKDLSLAAEGFKDTTRVASSDPALWADIFLSNRLQLIRSGRMFEKYYREVVKALSKKDYPAIVRLLKAAKSKRDKFVYGKKA